MSYSQETTHYGIPKPLGTDLTTPMDYNQAADAIDTAVWQASQDSSSAASAAASAVSTANAASSAVSALDSEVTTLEGTVTTQGTAITGLASDITDVRADVTDNICAVKEATATATYAHAVGEYFYYNDILYRTTVAITIGDTIVPNTNCEAVTAATELEYIRANLVPVLVENAFTAEGGYISSSIRVEKMGRMVRIAMNGDIENLTTAGNTKTLGHLSLASGCVPSHTVDGISCNYSEGNANSYCGWISIDSTGLVAIRQAGTSKYTEAQLTYLV